MYCATMEKVACRSRHLCSKFIDRWICEEHAAQCCTVLRGVLRRFSTLFMNLVRDQKNNGISFFLEKEKKKN